MERLTCKTGLGYQGTRELRRHIVNEEQYLLDKLGQFEDFMDEYHFESIKDLEGFIQSCINRVRLEVGKINL